MNQKIKYIVSKTLGEILINIVYFFDFVTPDFTVLTFIRVYYRKLVAKIGKGTRLRKGQFITDANKLIIGNNCYLNTGNIFDNNSLIQIGNNCSIGYRNQFLTTTHLEKNIQLQKGDMTIITKPILVGNNVWIASNCIILPGVNIGDNCIIASGSVVNKDCENNCVYGGVPAKKIRNTEGFISKSI